MAARLEGGQKAVNQKILSRKSGNLGATFALLEDAVGAFEDSGRSRRNLLCSYSRKTFYTDSAGTFTDMSEREKTLTINEIYHSLQGESTWAGWPCVFVRLTFCNLRCNYCDTEYAFYEGIKKTLGEILDAVAAYRCPLVEITGGEPLLQKNMLPLMSMLCDLGYTVLLETSGAHDISSVDPRVHRIMDLKTPGSGEVDKNLWSNIDHLTARDEVKFVMGSREDYEWSRDKVQRYDLPSRCHAVLFSPIFGRIDPREIVEWILADKLDVRFQLQMHKFIWRPTQRGV
jgi:7-carboxy-7-deazaguanine synthase